MSKIEKLLVRMRANSRGWRIEELENIAKRFDIDVKENGRQSFRISAHRFRIGGYYTIQTANQAHLHPSIPRFT